MKSPVQPFKPELERVMLAARQTMAQALFDPVVVKSRLIQAAGEGQSSCLLSAPLDLRATEAAAVLLTWCKQERLRATWSSRPANEAHGEAGYDLLISWITTSTDP